MYVKPPDVDDLSLIKQKPGESIHKFWTRFLKKKNKIVDCSEVEASQIEASPAEKAQRPHEFPGCFLPSVLAHHQDRRDGYF